MKPESLYLKVINNLHDGVYFVTYDRKISFWNEAAERISGYTASEVMGRCCSDALLNHIDVNGRPLCVVGCPLYASMIDGKQRKDEVFLRHKDGHRVPVHVNIFPVYEDDKITGAIEIFSANSPIIYADDLVEKLSNMAMRDELTQVPNRRYLQSYLEYRLSEFARFGTPFALMFMDIDHFRDFNNNYGHDKGDTVLVNVAASIKRVIRRSDLFGRWGGEEFVGIYAIKSEYDVPIIAEKVRILVENTIIPHTEPLSVTASIGITQVQPGDTAESIVERADMLMYQSKENGRNRVTCG